MSGAAALDAYPLKVAILAPHHPAQQGARASQSAYGLFERLKAVPNVAPIFIAAETMDGTPRSGRVRLHEGRSDELLLSVPRLDRRHLFTSDGRGLETLLGGVLSRLQPDIVHVHHQGGFGLDCLRIAADFWIPAVLTPYDGLDGGGLAGAPAEAEDSSVRFVRQRLLSETLANARAVIAPNRLLAARLKEALPEAVEQHVIASLDDAETEPGQTRRKATRWSASRPPAAPARAQDAATTPIRCGFFASSTGATEVKTFKAGVDLLPRDRAALLDLGVYTQTSLGERKAGAREAIELRDAGDTRLHRIREAVAICDCVAVADLDDPIGFAAVQEAASLGIPILCPQSEALTGPGIYQFGPKAAHIAASLIDLCDLWAAEQLLPSSREDSVADIVGQHVELYRRIVFGTVDDGSHAVEDEPTPTSEHDAVDEHAVTSEPMEPSLVSVPPVGMAIEIAFPAAPPAVPVPVEPVAVGIAPLHTILQPADAERSQVAEQATISQILEAMPASSSPAAPPYAVQLNTSVALPDVGAPGRLNQFWSKLKKSFASSSAS